MPASRIRFIASGLLSLCFSAGCIPAPSTVAVNPVSLTAVPNPSGKSIVYISRVTDRRQFTSDLSDPSVPCMITSTNLSNPAIKLQTIGIYHKTNVTLQPGQTVESIVSDAIANGLRAKGYTVAPSGTVGTPVEAQINRCWMWAGRGDMGLKMKTVVEISLSGALTTSGNAETIQAEYEINTPFTTVSEGLATIDDALDALSKNLQPAIKAP